MTLMCPVEYIVTTIMHGLRMFSNLRLIVSAIAHYLDIFSIFFLSFLTPILFTFDNLTFFINSYTKSRIYDGKKYIL